MTLLGGGTLTELRLALRMPQVGDATLHSIDIRLNLTWTGPFEVSLQSSAKEIRNICRKGSNHIQNNQT